MEKSSSAISYAFILQAIFSFSFAASTNGYDNFLECLSRNNTKISSVLYTFKNASYTSTLFRSIQNLRFTTASTPKPHVIITPDEESEIPPIILCAKKNGFQIRTRSGGHDFEGLSYTSQVPFVVIDLVNLRGVAIDVKQKTGWVQSGATLGELYHKIAMSSPILAFPGGFWPTIGVGGHFGGGGYGTLLRKYGLAADNIVDARIADVQGRILDRKSMGEDLFWAIRGGGAASFGVVIAWKINLVDVPEKVTVFTIRKSKEENAIQLVHRWQFIASKFDPNLLIRIVIHREKENTNQNSDATTVRALFSSIYFGGVDELLPLMNKSFPELGLTKEDCQEMRWIESILYFFLQPIKPLEILLNRTQPEPTCFKGKSDYVQTLIPETGLQGIWSMFDVPEFEQAQVFFTPYGAKMDEIPASSIPFPHRAGNLFKILHIVNWRKDENGNADKFVNAIRKLYSYVEPYVSKNPRATYLNYRDLDIGANAENGNTSYEQASVWGKKYFQGNFDRLVKVKTKVDPENYFRNEQSIPSV